MAAARVTPVFRKEGGVLTEFFSRAYASPLPYLHSVDRIQKYRYLIYLFFIGKRVVRRALFASIAPFVSKGNRMAYAHSLMALS